MLLSISSFENDIFGFFFPAVRDNGTMMLVSEFLGSNTALISSCDDIEGSERLNKDMITMNTKFEQRI